MWHLYMEEKIGLFW